jgi:murein DD-endopeptidase MepM/ murein hydrolase activator NlpD
MTKQLPSFFSLALLINLLFSFNCAAVQLIRLNTVIEMNIGESQKIRLNNGDIVHVSLLDVIIERDSLRGAVRDARVRLTVDGKEITIGSGNYHLPVTTGKVQIDCPVIKEYTVSNYYRHDGALPKDVRLRLWPKDSPFIQPGTFGFPLSQRWLAGRMQSQNELAGLGWAEDLKSTNAGYHAPHDFGGAEGMDEIIAATDGLVVSANKEVLEGYEDLPGDVRPDVIWVVDGRGWYYRYSHLNSIEPEIVPGATVAIGQKLGYMGKQGGSGGWVHLHFGVHHKNPETSKWEVEDAWPYLWEAWVNRYKPGVVAVARPRQLIWTGQETTLDGTKSRSLEGDIEVYEWTFTDGTKAKGPVQKRSYDKAGEYSEILKVTDTKGNVDYDFTYIQVFDRQHPENQIPTIHPAYHPSLGIKPGDPVTFLVRTFGSQTGNEIWDFGDGSGKVTVNSGEVQRKTQNQGEYATVVHTFSKPGNYVVRVERTNQFGYPAIGHLHVVITR